MIKFVTQSIDDAWLNTDLLQLYIDLRVITVHVNASSDYVCDPVSLSNLVSQVHVNTLHVNMQTH